jgi:hypothetical protein
VETASKSKHFETLSTAVKNAGFTEDSVVDAIKKVNVDELLSKTMSVVNDKDAQQAMLSSATDSALDFLLSVLPNVDIPVLEGVKDGVIYKISDLSLKGFQVRKEDISVQIAGMSLNGFEAPAPPADADMEVQLSSSASSTSSASSASPTPATELLIIRVDNILARMTDVNWKFEQTYGRARATSEARAKEARARAKRVQRRCCTAAFAALLGGCRGETPGTPPAAGEVAPVYMLHKHPLTPSLPPSSFARRYFPYLKGEGSANATVSNGYLELKFELRKKELQGDEGGILREVKEFEPVRAERSASEAEYKRRFDDDI